MARCWACRPTRRRRTALRRTPCQQRWRPGLATARGTCRWHALAYLHAGSENHMKLTMPVRDDRHCVSNMALVDSSMMTWECCKRTATAKLRGACSRTRCVPLAHLGNEVKLVEAGLRVHGAVVPHKLVLFRQLHRQRNSKERTHTASASTAGRSRTRAQEHDMQQLDACNEASAVSIRIGRVRQLTLHSMRCLRHEMVSQCAHRSGRWLPERHRPATATAQGQHGLRLGDAAREAAQRPQPACHPCCALR